MCKTIHIDTKHQVFWLSYEYLMKHGVLEDTINKWHSRDVCKRKYIDDRVFINYDTIPEPTRLKLPTKEEMKAYKNRERVSYVEGKFTEWLQEAYRCPNIIKWQKIIREKYDVSLEKATVFARRASVFEKVIELYDRYKFPKDFTALCFAYKNVYPNNYTYNSRFLMAIKRVKKEGVLSVAVDARTLRRYEGKYKEDCQYKAEFILSHPKCFLIPDAYELFVEACTKDNMEVPSISWFEKYYYKNRNRIDRNRMGESAWQKKHGNYAKLIQALYRGDQWQMDGWEIPIYAKRRTADGKTEIHFKYILFAIIDSHSRKIIGHRIAESENTETILQALEMAVKETNILPFEIVADNHSFNKTKEADYLKAETDRMGMTWTVDSNPRRKVLVERMFKTLGSKHYKKHYGYFGQGIKTKEKDGRIPQELMDLYTKNSSMFLDYAQIVAITEIVIYEYNNSVMKSLKASPNERYTQSEQPNSIPVDIFTRMALFNRHSEHKVSHGQIIIKRGQYTYEYQLPSEYSVQYNGKDVGVRYADFSQIYLYDLETDAPICSIPQKSEIHAALANQSETDTEKYHKNTGRIMGNNTKVRKQKENLTDTAIIMNPDAIDTLNKVTTSKDVLKELSKNQRIREEMIKQGVNPERVTELPKVDEMLDSSMKPRKKENKHPFSVKGNEIKRIEIDL